MRKSFKNAILLALFFFLAAPSFASQTVHRHLEPETVVYQALSAAAQTQFTTNENIKLVKYGAGVTLAAVTANFSLVDGTAFVTNPSVDLRSYVGFKLSTNDGSVGYAKAAGGGETLGAELSPNSTALADGATEANATTGYAAHSTPTTFASVSTGTPHAGTYHFSVVTQAAGGQGFTQSTGNSPGGDATGKLIKHTWWQKSDNTNRIRPIVYNTTTGTPLYVGAYQTSNVYTLITAYATGIDASTKLRVDSADSAITTFYVDTYSAQQVTAPSATGVTIVSTAGGTTYNWIAKGTTPNAASFTVTVTRN